MALEGPRLIYTRNVESSDAAEKLHRALRLAREIEDLLEEASSSRSPQTTGAHSTRIVRAMSASLVDELEAISRGIRKTALI